MNNFNKVPQEWNRFLSGKWMKQIPEKPGEYPVADRSGNHSGFIKVTLYKGKCIPIQSWDGWWWSESYPGLPRPNKVWNEREKENNGN